MVTNKHVVRGDEEGSFFFIQADEQGGPRLGHGIEVPIPQFASLWYGHPNDSIDVAIMPLHWLLPQMKEQDLRTFVAPVLRGHVPPPDEVANMDAIEEILFVGYPNARYDKQNLTPIIRRGTTATPLELDYDGEPKFLIDASVFPGSSDSPVFVADIATYKDKQGNVHLGASRRWFLGIISAGFLIEDDGRLELEPIPTTRGFSIKTRQMIDLGVAYKSSTVVETVEDYLKALGPHRLEAD